MAGNPDRTENRKIVQTIRNGVILPRISLDDEPVIPVGMSIIWHDADDSKVYLLYNDPVEGQVKVELT